MKREIDPFEYAPAIIKPLKPGLLLTTKADDRVNSMIIGWGTLGVIWKKPIFTVFVREGRFTHELMEKNPEFTVNVPTGPLDGRVLDICGMHSGRSIDKIAEAGLTLEPPMSISVPGIKEFPLTLECRVVYRDYQTSKYMDGIDLDTLYPRDVPSDFPRSNRDFHTAYSGEIVSAYIIE